MMTPNSSCQIKETQANVNSKIIAWEYFEVQWESIIQSGWDQSVYVSDLAIFTQTQWDIRQWWLSKHKDHCVS